MNEDRSQSKCDDSNFTYVQQPEEQFLERAEEHNRSSTRGERKVRFPERLQAGFWFNMTYLYLGIKDWILNFENFEIWISINFLYDTLSLVTG